MLVLIEGPAGGGKSDLARELLESGEVDLLADVTELWAATGGYTRGPDGKYPVRTEPDPALSMGRFLQYVAVGFALREGYKILATTSQRDQTEKWQAVANRYNAPLSVRTVDPGREVVEARLRDPVTGELDPECESALSRWYK